jgi:hypothetical protein
MIKVLDAVEKLRKAIKEYDEISLSSWSDSNGYTSVSSKEVILRARKLLEEIDYFSSVSVKTGGKNGE